MQNIVKYIIISIVLLKILVLPLGSYPFDFAAFVYQARSFFDYGINPLFYLNKGLPIILLFYIPYSIYTFIMGFLGGGENVLLLHAIYKLPLLLLDLGTAYFLWRIIGHYTKSIAVKQYGVLLWLANPFVFWMTEFQGQYAIFVVFFMVLSIYFALVKNSFIPTLVTLAVATSIYYYPVIFLPFIILWFSRNALSLKTIIGKVFRAGLVFLTSLTFLYLPFILMPSYLLGLINSLLYHSAPDAPQGHAEITVPLYSLFRLPYYLMTNEWPSNTSSPAYFKMVGLMTFIGLGLIGIYSIFRLFKSIRSRTYQTQTFLIDLVVVVTIFIVLIGKLQSHYLLWLFPLYILAFCILNSKKIFPFFVFLGIIPVVVILGYTNLSVFLVDILPWDTVSIYLDHLPYTQALGGFLTVLLIISAAFMVVRHKPLAKAAAVKQELLYVWMFFFLLMFVMTGYCYYSLVVKGVNPRLASEEMVYNYSFINKNKEHTDTGADYFDIALPDASFEGNYGKREVSYGYLEQTASPWYFYNYGDNKTLTASVTDSERYYGNQSLRMEATGDDANGQVSIAKEGLMIPIDSNSLYSVGAAMKSVGIENGEGKLSARFTYANGEIISGSDVTITEISGTKDWQKYQSDILPLKAASYIQILVSLNGSAEKHLPKGAVLFADDIRIAKKEQNQTHKFGELSPKGNKPAIYSNIINNEEAKHKFRFDVTVSSVPKYARVVYGSLNDCTSAYTPEPTADNDKLNYIASFPVTCFNTQAKNSATINSVNIPDPDIYFKLVHITQEYTMPGWRKTILLALSGVGIIVIVSASAVIVRKFRHIINDKQ